MTGDTTSIAKEIETLLDDYDYYRNSEDTDVNGYIDYADSFSILLRDMQNRYTNREIDDRFGRLTYNELLDILGALRRQIIRNGKEYPTVCIDDLFTCINHVLETENYKGYYEADNNKNYK